MERIGLQTVEIIDLGSKPFNRNGFIGEHNRAWDGFWGLKQGILTQLKLKRFLNAGFYPDFNNLYTAHYEENTRLWSEPSKRTARRKFDELYGKGKWHMLEVRKTGKPYDGSPEFDRAYLPFKKRED